MIKQITTTRIIIKADAPSKFKREVSILLKGLMKDYMIGSISQSDRDGFEKAFMDTFKSNLYYLIDNYYDVKAQKSTKPSKTKGA